MRLNGLILQIYQSVILTRIQSTKLCRIFQEENQELPAKEKSRAIPHNAARADSEKNRVLMMALFRRNTLCIARKSDEIRARFFRKMPQAYCAVLP
jgi:hypothetical protein